MKIQTAMLGEVDVQEQDVVTFEPAMYGLDEYRRFTLLRPDETLPFAYLQSVEEAGVCLLVADPFVFRADYAFDLSEADLADLKQPAAEDLVIWVTVTAPDTLETATMNLLAPIVIHTKQQVARQIVLHEAPYATKTPLFPPKEG